MELRLRSCKSFYNGLCGHYNERQILYYQRIQRVYGLHKIYATNLVRQVRLSEKWFQDLKNVSYDEKK